MALIPNVMNTGRSGMVAAKAAIATAGHNVANATTEGYTRQRVDQESQPGVGSLGSRAIIGNGTKVSRVERINDEYLDKQIRHAGRDMAHSEEKELVLGQTEDIFNEMGGEGLNRLMAHFFNQFRKLANDPDNEAVRQSVREASQAMVNDFHRIRKEVEDVRGHIDSRIEGHIKEINTLAKGISDLNLKIQQMELSGASPNDLLDKRDLMFKQLSEYVDVSMHKDDKGNYDIDIRGVGPLVTGNQAEQLSSERSPADGRGKAVNDLDIRSTGSAQNVITHSLKGGKVGALLETRDQTLSTILQRLDALAETVTKSVNEIHRQGFTRDGAQGVNFFKPVGQADRAAEMISLSDAVKENVNNIATAAIPDAPGDNRVALAISGLQGMHLMNGGKTTVDDFYNSIVSDVGVARASNRSSLNQAKDIQNQLGKVRDQISGVSIDEETANLLQFQHAFNASAKVIQIADQCLKTILDMR